MSNRPRSMPPAVAIVAIVLALLTGAALVTVSVALFALGAIPTLAIAGLSAGSLLGVAVVTCIACRWVRSLVQGGGGHDDDEGGGRRGPDEPEPTPPFDEPDWWPAFERDFRAYVEVRERAPLTV